MSYSTDYSTLLDRAAARAVRPVAIDDFQKYTKLTNLPPFPRAHVERHSSKWLTLPNLLIPLLPEGHRRWSKCGRRARPFRGRALRERRANVGVLPILCIVGVPRAQRITGAALTPSHSENTELCRYSPPFMGMPKLAFTARIERALFHRARSASKKATWAHPSPLAYPANDILTA